MDVVETDRLLLRRWRPDDLDALSHVFAKPEVWWYPFKRGWTRDETEAFLDRKLREWDTRGWSQWAAVEKDTGTLIGFLGLNPPEFLPEVMPAVEVGWRLDPDYWGRGLATEGGRAALHAGFTVLQLDEIVSIYEPDNAASGRVMEHLGMTLERETTHPKLGVPLRVLRIDRATWVAREGVGRDRAGGDAGDGLFGIDLGPAGRRNETQDADDVPPNAPPRPRRTLTERLATAAADRDSDSDNDNDNDNDNEEPPSDGPSPSTP